MGPPEGYSRAGPGKTTTWVADGGEGMHRADLAGCGLDDVRQCAVLGDLFRSCRRRSPSTVVLSRFPLCIELTSV